MKGLTENQKRGLEYFEGLNKVQLIIWARKTDSRRACMELLGEKLTASKDGKPRYVS